jgi:hypothetical protein
MSDNPTREVVLRGQISGTRNGKNWPPPGTRLVLDKDEADGLVKGQMAYEVDDPRVAAPLTDEILAGAPEARDWTAGQPDTNLDRARVVAGFDDSVGEVRAAAERAGLDDAHTVPGADPREPIVGDDKPNPTDAPSLVALPQEVTVSTDSTPDDGARLVDDQRGDVETASVDPDAGTEVKADVSKPAGRRVAKP